MARASTSAAATAHRGRGDASHRSGHRGEEGDRRSYHTSRTPQSVSPSSSVESLLQVRSRPRPLKVVLVGASSVGKTSLRNVFFTRRFQYNYKATIGADFEAKVIEVPPADSWIRRGKHGSKGKGKVSERQGSRPAEDSDEEGEQPGYEYQGLPSRKVLLSVWDTAGQERFRSLSSAFYRGSDAVLICFDASNRSEDQVRSEIAEWYHDFREKSGISDEEERTYNWIAVGCKADLRQEGAVKRKSVRAMLNRLVARTGPETDIGLQTTGKGEGHGDEPPADPQDVLAREGMHEEDDRNFDIAPASTSSAEATDAAVAQPSEGESDPFVDPTTNGKVESSEENGQGSGGDTVKPSPVASGAVTPKPDHTTRTENSTRPSQSGLHLFPSSAEAPRTPPSKLSVPYSSSSAARNQEIRRAGKGRSSSRARNRLDSSISMASSIYHTPRNSHFGSITPSSSVSTLAAGGNNSAYILTDEEREKVEEEGESSDAETEGKKDVDGQDEIVPSKAGGAEGQPPASEATIRDVAPPRRTLSSASAQSIVSGKKIQVVNADKHDDDDDKDRHEPAVPRRRSGSDALVPLSLPPPPPRPLRGFSLFYTSSLTGENVTALFEHVVTRCVRKWDWEEWETVRYRHRHPHSHHLDLHLQGLGPESKWTATNGDDDLALLARQRDRRMQRRRKKRLSVLNFFSSTFKVSSRRGRIRLGGDRGSRVDSEDELDDEERLHEEMRRMVRLSDGKGDDNSRLRGCCC